MQEAVSRKKEELKILSPKIKPQPDINVLYYFKNYSEASPSIRAEIVDEKNKTLKSGHIRLGMG